MKDEELYMQHHIIKTYLACASSLLISAGKFKESYRKTNAEFQRLYSKKFPELAKRIDDATKMKISPHKEMRNIKERWFLARDDLTFVLSYISEKHLKIKARSIQELTRMLYRKLPYVYFTPYLPFGSLSRMAFPSQYVLNILYFTRTHYINSLFLWRDIGIRIALAAFLLLHSLDNPELNNDVYSHIKTFYPVKSKKWEDLRKSLLYAFDGYFSQKII